MPRRRQTRTGADAQNIDSVPGQRYGEGVEQQQLQQTMPAPDGPAPVATSAPPGPGGAVPPSPQQPVDEAAIQAYLQRNNPALLAGTQLPGEPVTAGLSTGPGAGPDALRLGASTTPIARYMSRLTQDTGNPKWAQLAERAGL